MSLVGVGRAKFGRRLALALIGWLRVYTLFQGAAKRGGGSPQLNVLT